MFSKFFLALLTLLFPENHGPHPKFQTEWWYITGHLLKDDDRPITTLFKEADYTFQLTFFRRRACTSSIIELCNNGMGEIHFAHAALLDVKSNTFYQSKRYARNGLSLSEKRFDPSSNKAIITNNDWSLNIGETLKLKFNLDSGASVLLEAENFSPLLHGDNGYSKKGDIAGYFSYYYSLPDLTLRGEVSSPSPTKVIGKGWFDHEFMDTFLGNEKEKQSTVGWDWIWLHLNDGSKLMVAQVRGTTHSGRPYTFGTYVDGTFKEHKITSFNLTEFAAWRSPKTSKKYVNSFNLKIPAHKLNLLISPLSDEQEIRDGKNISYWEGSVRAKAADGKTVGYGFVELAGSESDGGIGNGNEELVIGSDGASP
jgi:predicted secreted hydrolase